MSTGPVHLQLAGVSARIDSAYAPFVDYAVAHLAPLRAADTAAPTVAATLGWHEGAPPAERSARFPGLERMQRVDRDLYRGDGELAWFRVDDLPPLHLRVQREAERLLVTGEYFFHLSPNRTRDRLKRIWNRRRVPALRQRRFTTLLYYLVYYPVFWWLERHRDTHPIHAAGVELDAGVVVLAGPSGVGKSTLSVALAGRAGARLLSDTFLLQCGGTVYPVREPLLLDTWSRRWVGEAANRLQPIAWRYCLNRQGFHWPAAGLSEGGPARVIVFPYRAAAPRVERVSSEAAHALLSAGDLIINDLRRYWAFAAVLDTLDPSPTMAVREQALARLTAAVPCFRIGLVPERSASEVVDEIIGLLRGADVSAPETGRVRASWGG
jgi:hypothetical protein